MLRLAPGELDVDCAFAELCATVDGDDVLVIEVEFDVRVSMLAMSASMLVREQYAERCPG